MIFGGEEDGAGGPCVCTVSGKGGFQARLRWQRKYISKFIENVIPHRI